MNNVDQDSQGHLYVLSPRGYSAYEVAVQQGFVGTEDEWLESLTGPEGPDGKSAYQVAVDNGYIGTEEDWVNDFLTPDGYYNKVEVDNKVKVKPNYFDTVADMKAASNLKDGDMVITLGYYNENDGGSAKYIITDTSSLSEYQEELENGLYATLILNKNNPCCYGAKANDNTFDNSLIITKMLDYTTIIDFPKNIYYFLTPITPVTKMTIDGNLSSLYYTGENYFIEHSTTSEIRSVIIKNCDINGNGTNKCMYLRKTVDCILSNLRICNFTQALKTYYSWDWLIERVRTQSCAKPLLLDSQSNNFMFNSCAFAQFSDKNEFTNCEGICFNSCEFNACTYTTAISSYSSSITFVNCYYEDITNKFITNNGDTSNYWNIIGGVCSDANLLINPSKTHLTFTTLRGGKVKIMPENTTTNNPAVSSSLYSLNAPSNYIPNRYNAHTYFDGTNSLTLNLYGTGTSQAISDGEIVISNSNAGNKGFTISSLEPGKTYLLIMDITTVNDTKNLIFQFPDPTLSDNSGFYSVTKSFDTQYVIFPFKAVGTYMRVYWTHTEDVKIGKLIVMES